VGILDMIAWHRDPHDDKSKNKLAMEIKFEVKRGVYDFNYTQFAGQLLLQAVHVLNDNPSIKDDEVNLWTFIVCLSFSIGYF